MSAHISGAGSRMGSSRVATFWGIAFAVLAVAAVLAFYWGGQQKALLEALKTKVERQNYLAASSGDLLGRIAQGRPLAFEALSDLDIEFSSNAEALTQENLEPSALSSSAEWLELVEPLKQEFGSISSAISSGMALKGRVSNSGPALRQLRNQLPILVGESQKLAAKLTSSLSPVSQVHTASQVSLQLEQLDDGFLAAAAGVEAANTTENASLRIENIGQLLNALLEGDRDLGIKRVTNVAARETLESLANAFNGLRGDFELQGSVSADLQSASALANGVARNQSRLKGLLEQYGVEVDKHFEQSDVIWKLGIALGALAVLALLLMVAQVQRDNRRQLQAIQEANQKSQNAILQLLDEMSTLADGDLTVEATVSEEITGAIADSVNYAIDEMRKLVQTINLSSVRVENTAKQTQSTTLELSESSKEQANQIERVSESIEDLNRSIDKVSQNAEDSAEVADSSVSLSQKGVRTVRGTIEGMDVIREKIQDTSKRIKRLGESSQEIGDIVGLITDIADQTNILALNAAIQASAAGEGGRGFAVVADEVQRLAERSSNASKQIEALVKTIQADTNEAVQSMEQSTSHVVRGANLAEDSGRALEEIETVSHRLAKLITDISGEAREQAILSDKVTELMGSIQRITGQTVAGTNDTALAVGELVEQSRFLKQSVEGFKLSEELEELDVDILNIDTEETEVEKPEDDALSLTSLTLAGVKGSRDHLYG